MAHRFRRCKVLQHDWQLCTAGQNFGVLGMQTKPLGSALNQADTFIEAMLGPRTTISGAGALYLKSRPLMSWVVLIR